MGGNRSFADTRRGDRFTDSGRSGDGIIRLPSARSSIHARRSLWEQFSHSYNMILAIYLVIN
jgi:hypothetical protein